METRRHAVLVGGPNDHRVHVELLGRLDVFPTRVLDTAIVQPGREKTLRPSPSEGDASQQVGERHPTPGDVRDGTRGNVGLERIAVALEDRAQLPSRKSQQLLEVEHERPLDHAVDP